MSTLSLHVLAGQLRRGFDCYQNRTIKLDRSSHAGSSAACQCSLFREQPGVYHQGLRVYKVGFLSPQTEKCPALRGRG